jgi:molecular chaperone GrpE
MARQQAYETEGSMVNEDKKTEERKTESPAEEPVDIAAPDSAATDDREAPLDPGSESASAWAGGDRAERAAALEAELSEMTDRWKRAAAEAENTRRRLQREKEESVRYAAAGFAKDMLSVADNLRRALDSVTEEALAADETVKALHDGVALVERELLGAFERNGVARIEPLGEAFDPNRHEAMFEVPDETRPSGTVVQILQPGYMLHERLLRAAMVGVANGGPPAAAPAKDEGDSDKPGDRVDETA